MPIRINPKYLFISKFNFYGSIRHCPFPVLKCLWQSLLDLNSPNMLISRMLKIRWFLYERMKAPKVFLIIPATHFHQTPHSGDSVHQNHTSWLLTSQCRIKWFCHRASIVDVRVPILYFAIFLIRRNGDADTFEQKTFLNGRKSMVYNFCNILKCQVYTQTQQIESTGICRLLD